MKPSSWEKQLGLVSPLKSAASQSGQTNNPSENETGLDASHHTDFSPEGRGENFFLDIPFHRMSVIRILRQPSGDNAVAGGCRSASTKRRLVYLGGAGIADEW